MTSSARVAGLGRFTSAQRESSLSSLREAAERLFLDQGYMAVSVDDIAKEAGVTRKTFYRHFEGKFDIAVDLFKQRQPSMLPIWTALRERDFNSFAVVHGWLDETFRIYSELRELRLFVEMAASEPRFVDQFKYLVADVIVELGKTIPAFAITCDSPQARRRWGEASLILAQTMDQCVLAARGQAQVDRDILLELLANRLLEFIRKPI